MSPFHKATREVAKGRLRKATEFAEAADVLTNDPTQSSSFVSLAILSSIASADVICIYELGGHNRGGSHEEASKLLSEVDKSLAKELSRLLAIKTTIEYTDKPATTQEVNTAKNSHLALLSRAKGLVQ